MKPNTSQAPPTDLPEETGGHHLFTEGLNDSEVILLREKYGINWLNYKKQNGFIGALKSVAKEPMVILLLVT